MTPNLLNTALGLVLVYFAILSPGSLVGNLPFTAGSGVAVALLALWGWARDRVKWFNATNFVLGVALVALGVLDWAIALPRLVLFWWVFWVGIVVSVFAFWSALYSFSASAER